MSELTVAAADPFAASLDPAARADPYAHLARLRDERVWRTGSGEYVVAGYADVHALLRDRRISSDLRKSSHGDPVRRGAAGEPTFLNLDPPAHTRIRSLVVREFRPGMVEALRGHVREVVDALLDAAPDPDVLELVGDVAYPLPVTIICELLGVPREDEPRFQDWSRLLAASLDGGALAVQERDAIMRAVVELRTYIAELMAQRRAEPRADYLSLLVAAEEGGRGLSDGEIAATVSLLLVAGHETTVNLVANAALQLLRDPALLARVQADPALVGEVVEETLRFDPPVQYRNRTCVEDIRIGDTLIPRGSAIVLHLAAANRDPARFPDPDRFDVDRPKGGHLGFGGGPHFCVGTPLARMEATIALEHLLRRAVAPALVHDPPPYRPASALRGPARLELRTGGLRPAG